MIRSLALLAALALALACKSDDDGNDLSNAQACQNVIDACHTKDDGSDPVINGCHEKAHNGGDCLSDYDMCIMACNEAPAVTDSHGHETDSHGTGGTHGTHGSGTHGSGTHGSGTHGTHGSDTGTGGTAGTAGSGGVGHHVGPHQ